MVGGCRVEIFDRAGGLLAAIYSVGHSGDNSTATLSSQPSHFCCSRGKSVLVPSSARLSRLSRMAFRCSPIRSTASRRAPAVSAPRPFVRSWECHRRHTFEAEEQHSEQGRRKKDLRKCRLGMPFN